MEEEKRNKDGILCNNNILDIDRGNGTSQETQKGMARNVPRELGENDAAEIMKM